MKSRFIGSGGFIYPFFLSAVLLLAGGSAAFSRVIGEDPAWERASAGILRRGEVNLLEKSRRQAAAGEYRAAARTYERMANLAKHQVNAAWATMQSAEMNIAAGRLDRAVVGYKKAIEQWPGEINFSKAMGRLREIAEVYAEQPGTVLGFIPVGRTGRAIEVYEFMIAKAPAGERTAQDRMRLAELQLANQQSQPAIKTYRDVFTRHPQSPLAPKARIEYVEMLFSQARRQNNSPQLLEAVQREARLFLRFHPEHELTSRAEKALWESEQVLGRHYLELAEFYMHPVRFNAAAARRYLELVINDYSETAAAPEARQKLRELEDEVRVRGDNHTATENSPVGHPGSVAAAASGNSPVANNPVSTPVETPAARQPAAENVPTYSVAEMARRDQVQKRLLPIEAAELPVFSSLGVARVRNLTREPGLANVMQRQLHEEIMREETISLENANRADLRVEVRIDNFLSRATASAKVRDEGDTPEELSTHTTTLYTAYLDLSYRVVNADQEVLIDWSPLQGQADFPRMPDMATARESALRQATTDAARKIVQAIAESW